MTIPFRQPVSQFPCPPTSLTIHHKGFALMPHQPTNRALYRKREKKKGPTRKVTFSVSEATIQGLDRIRTAFRRRYPQAAFPTMSAVLESVITKDLKRLSRPDQLAKEVADFEKRYPKHSTKPATIQEVQ